MHNFGPFAVAVSVFVFLAIATVAGIVGDYKKRQATLQLLRTAIERGQPLDPALVERLTAPERRDDELHPVHLKVGGIITLAAGIGVAIVGYFIGQIPPLTFYPVLGLGIIAACVGVGLIVAAGVVERAAARRTPGG